MNIFIKYAIFTDCGWTRIFNSECFPADFFKTLPHCRSQQHSVPVDSTHRWNYLVYNRRRHCIKTRKYYTRPYMVKDWSHSFMVFNLNTQGNGVPAYQVIPEAANYPSPYMYSAMIW